MPVNRVIPSKMYSFGRLLKPPPISPPRSVAKTVPAPVVAVPAAPPSIDDRAREAREAAARARKAEFRTFGAFLQTVAQSAAEGSRQPDPRLTRAPSGLSESDPTGGGFLVPDAYATELIGSIYEAAVIAPMCDRHETSKPNNLIVMATGETSRAEGSRWGGVLAYWVSESVTPPSSFPRWKQVRFSAHSLVVLVHVTKELLDDQPMLESWLRRVAASEFAFQLDKAILFGTPGMLSGVVGASGSISVAKDVGQAAGTITGSNLGGMWNRLAAPCRKNAVWLINQDLESQLATIEATAGTAATTGMYYYHPPGANGDPYARVNGAPVIVAEQCSVAGAPGDIVLGDFSNYLLVDGGLQNALSLDVDFLTEQACFRFKLRVDGRSAWPNPISDYNGVTTRSAFVTLAQR